VALQHKTTQYQGFNFQGEGMRRICKFKRHVTLPRASTQLVAAQIYTQYLGKGVAFLQNFYVPLATI
jgi:hypothetical protein